MGTSGRSLSSFASLIVMIGLAFAGSAGIASAGGEKDILGTVKMDENCRTFAKALIAAGLDQTLRGNGPLTVFVPTDEAFAAMADGTLQDLMRPENNEKLKNLLNYHLAKGKLMERHLLYMDWATTLNGEKVVIRHKHGDLTLAKKAKVIKTDIPCSNGVIHMIDHVLMP